jgi:hypothetical protein
VIFCLDIGEHHTEKDVRYKKIAVSKEKMDEYLIKVFLQAQTEGANTPGLDADATDDQVRGRQEGRYFLGYYRGF